MVPTAGRQVSDSASSGEAEVWTGVLLWRVRIPTLELAGRKVSEGGRRREGPGLPAAATGISIAASRLGQEKGGSDEAGCENTHPA